MPLHVLSEGPAFQAAVKWREAGGQTAVNVLSFDVDAGGTAADLATAMGANATTHMFDHVSENASAIEVIITPYDGTSSGTPYTLASWVGIGGTDWEPAVSVVLTCYTGIGTRSDRGRIYLPFIGESAISKGFVTYPAIAAAEAAWNTWMSAMGDDGFTPIVASLITTHTSHGVPTTPSTPHGTPINRVKLQPVAGTQRRRQSRLRTS